MRKSAVGLIVVGVAASLAMSACSSSKKNTPTTPAGGATSASSSSAAGGAIDGKGAKVGAIMPDTQSSNRWITSDPEAIKAQCVKDNLQCDVENANNDAGQMATIAQTMINNGVKVLLIVNLDSASAAKIESDAKAKGVITIDYDRLTLGGSASVYVSFDGVAVGTAQGNALVKCPQVQGKSAVNYVDINGSKNKIGVGNTGSRRTSTGARTRTRRRPARKCFASGLRSPEQFSQKRGYFTQRN